jgi:hypothetical protein
MAIRFFVERKDAPTEGAVQSKKLEFRNGMGIEILIRHQIAIICNNVPFPPKVQTSVKPAN